MTLPTIAELNGNTVLELFENGYNAVKKDVNNKQEKLVAGDNIIINGNVISAIEGGTPALQDYYTKEDVDSITDSIEDDIQAVANELPDMTLYYTKTETNDEINNAVSTKANSSDVYTKSEVDNLIGDKIEVIDAILSSLTGVTSAIKIDSDVKDGDILVCDLKVSDGGNISDVFKGVITKGGKTSCVVGNKSGSLISTIIKTLEQSVLVGKEIVRVNYETVNIYPTADYSSNYMTITPSVSSIKIYRKVTE